MKISKLMHGLASLLSYRRWVVVFMPGPVANATSEPNTPDQKLRQISRWNASWEKADELLKLWLTRARNSQHSHHEAGKIYLTRHYWFGIPVVVLTTVLGTAAFATEKTVSDLWKHLFGYGSMVAAALTAAQTHFQWAERAEKHKSLGARYGDIRRDIEEILSLPFDDRGDPKEALGRIRTRLDSISAEGPVVPEWIWNHTLKMLAKKDRLTTSKRSHLSGNTNTTEAEK